MQWVPGSMLASLGFTDQVALGSRALDPCTHQSPTLRHRTLLPPKQPAAQIGARTRCKHGVRRAQGWCCGDRSRSWTPIPPLWESKSTNPDRQRTPRAEPRAGGSGLASAGGGASEGAELSHAPPWLLPPPPKAPASQAATRGFICLQADYVSSSLSSRPLGPPPGGPSSRPLRLRTCLRHNGAISG